MGNMSGDRTGSGLVTFLSSLAFILGCESKDAVPSPGKIHSVGFLTGELATGVGKASVAIRGPSDLTQAIQTISGAVRVFAWPELVPVGAAKTTGIVMDGQTENGALILGYGWIDLQLDAGVNEALWYGVGMMNMPEGFRWLDESALFTFGDGTKGIRFSPAHPPVVTSLVACPKSGTSLSVQLTFSEPVLKAADAVSLNYGQPAAACSMLQDTPTVIDFSCPGADARALLVATTSGSITAMASGRSMLTGTVRSDAMQPAEAIGGCVNHKPLLVDGP
jgi:hypothetical protein